MNRPGTAPLDTAPDQAGIASFTVCGDVARPITLTVADLRDGWRQHSTDVTFDCATNGPQHRAYEGPLLYDIMRSAQPGFDPERRKDRSRFLLSISGGDGHHMSSPGQRLIRTSPPHPYCWPLASMTRPWTWPARSSWFLGTAAAPGTSARSQESGPGPARRSRPPCLLPMWAAALVNAPEGPPTGELVADRVMSLDGFMGLS